MTPTPSARRPSAGSPSAGSPPPPAGSGASAGTSIPQLLEALDRLTSESQSSEELVWTVRARVTMLRHRYRETGHEFTGEQLERLRAVAAVPDLVADYCAARDEAARIRFRDEVETLVSRLVGIERALAGRRFAEQVASQARQLRALQRELPVRAIPPEAPDRQVRERFVQSQAGLCEHCGRAMRLREGLQGYFWSCAGFPSCFGAHRLAPEHEALLSGAPPEGRDAPDGPRAAGRPIN